MDTDQTTEEPDLTFCFPRLIDALTLFDFGDTIAAKEVWKALPNEFQRLVIGFTLEADGKMFESLPKLFYSPFGSCTLVADEKCSEGKLSMPSLYTNLSELV